MPREHPGGAPTVVFEDGSPTPVTDPVYPGEELQGEGNSYDKLGMALTSIINWLSCEGKGKPEGVMVRAFAFCWLVRPDIFGNPKPSAMAKRIGVSKSVFGRAVSSFRDEFHFVNEFLRSNSARRSYSARQRKIAARRAA